MSAMMQREIALLIKAVADSEQQRIDDALKANPRQPSPAYIAARDAARSAILAVLAEHKAVGSMKASAIARLLGHDGTGYTSAHLSRMKKQGIVICIGQREKAEWLLAPC